MITVFSRVKVEVPWSFFFRNISKLILSKANEFQTLNSAIFVSKSHKIFMNLYFKVHSHPFVSYFLFLWPSYCLQKYIFIYINKVSKIFSLHTSACF
jgi:hypothetical protein